ncbi:MAG: protein kinase [Planctomycetes bacterium]|nr:protein kinase [Planctomycetota bacterium]
MNLHDPETLALLHEGRVSEAVDRLSCGEAPEDASLLPVALRLGAILTDTGDYVRAAPYLEEACGSPDPQVRAAARAYRALAVVHTTGERSAVFALLEQGFAEAGGGAACGLLHHVRAVAALKQGWPSKAAADLLAADRFFRGDSNDWGQAAVLDSWGQYYELTGRPERAVACFARSIARKALTGDRLGLALTLGSLGRLNLRLGYLDDALACFEEDLELSRKLGDRRGEARMLGDVARAHLAAGKLDRADAALEAALDAARALASPRLEMLVRKDRAQWHVLHGNWRAARVELKRARRCLAGRKDVPRALAAIVGVVEARARIQAGDIDTGIRLLTAAARLFSARDVREHYVEILRDLALAHGKAGRKHAALDHGHRALRLARRLAFPRLVHLLEQDLRILEALESPIEPEPIHLVFPETQSTAHGRYEVIGCLGEGGFGHVFRALDRLGDLGVVAVKVLELARMPDVREREQNIALYLQEARLLDRVDHPNVVRVHERGWDEQRNLLLVMDCIEGEPLSRRLQRDGRLAETDLLRLARGTVGALQAIHRAGVLHRDLKPANIMLRHDGEPVVVDFGIALLLGRQGRTGRQRVYATFPYAAPEQLAGKALTPAADLYALGVVLYEAVAGRLPVEARDDEDLEAWLRAKTTARIPSLQRVAPRLSLGLSRLVDRLLAPRPGRRPQSADEVMDAL